jgi:hypothetical protein
MKTNNVLAAGFLGLGFAWVSVVTLFVEPGMGFATPADFFDARKVVEGYTSSVWLVSSLVYLAFPVAVLTIVRASDDQLLRWAGAGSALLWLVVGAVDRVGVQLPTLLPTNGAVIAAVSATLPIRFALLKSAVVCLGVFAWRTTRHGTSERAAARLWAGFGWVVLALSVSFMFAFIPVPVIFAVWGLGLTVEYLRAPPRAHGLEGART